ncbi:hypothetical protein HZS61_006623 [Fusarium oxysporum f. sp. conglutinans]|uniref:Alpha-L-rhamnosidase six-hairpin glycosidase domain-containing protein n=1 Tax=Fusarium oxysporum f. sp. conglutinans TaxID=100902 RepID=A0A8H6G8C5_FUSOX|nr:hypothetical protein HZS61_006623 [Fusarium oxysporum f. sp. conglutinans]
MASLLSTAWVIAQVATVSGLAFNVPSSPPSNSSAQLADAPVGVSFEFFAFPGYWNDVPSTSTCLQNLKDLSGTWPPIRIGGTTQDRATYDASSSQQVTYTVANAGDAPSTLTFGPSFMSLAGTYDGKVTIGFNRRLNNLANTVAAAAKAVDQIGSLHAIELGNEPNFFSSSDPIAQGSSWTASADYASEVTWQDAVCGNLSASNLISAGVFFGTSPMSIAGLTAAEGQANSYVRQYCSHNYPQSKSTANLATLMSHSAIASQIKPFANEVAAAAGKNKPHVFGETNSATQGGGGISPTYGAGLWLLDYVMQSLIMGTETLYFHHGTIGNCQYCWWGRYSMGSPYFGAYFATMALAGADRIAPLDDQTTGYAAYAIFKDDKPIRVLLYNSDYYTSGSRPSQSFTLSGLSGSTVSAKRLTAAASTSRVDAGQSPTIINQLQSNWIWIPDWVDSSKQNTAARIVTFIRKFTLPSQPTRALLHFSADTRYKLIMNGTRVAVGPARGSPLIWYYDSLDIAPHLTQGDNEIHFVVIRYFAASRGGMPFERTSFPGLTVVGGVESDGEFVSLDSREGWLAEEDNSILFPMGRPDDVFLHINEQIVPSSAKETITPVPYNIKTLNGELPPWRLRSRVIPTPEKTPASVNTVRKNVGSLDSDHWVAYLSGQHSIILAAGSSHTLEVQADVHSTAFLRWTFKATQKSQIRMKVTYSEGYENEPRSYPFFRSKSDRLDATNGHIIGPYDDVTLDLPASQTVVYEPFWFRTFRVMRWEITAGAEAVELSSFDATQVNYPLAVKASWDEPGDKDAKQIWDVSIRTMRNCMFDGYSDCPFYEQLQYSGDSRSVGLFHYLLSGDDRLMRQTITNFAASVTPEGLTQSRFPSHVPQIIAGFSLYWILQICDHHLYFGDTAYARSFLPRIDGVFEFFESHIDGLGLVSGFPEDVWQYVDWVTTWGATDTHPDKGVPTSGRESNRHTYFSMLYAYVLKQAARLVRDVGRPGYADEYESRAASVVKAIRTHCFDGKFFTDSTADIAGEEAHSQHCQVFAVLSGAATPEERPHLLKESFSDPDFSKCSYVMMFYALRAFALAGDEVYESAWGSVWDPWRKMLANNLTTWEEDDVRQRSDCHAWGSVPVYEYCTELAGLHVIAPGSSKILFSPRLNLSRELKAKVALGSSNTATVSWSVQDDGRKKVELRLESPVWVISKLPEGDEKDCGAIDHLTLSF